jgi:hypothetical protein
MGKGNLHAETTSQLTTRLYAALRHSPGCSCGECSGGLNAVDEMERRILAAEAERDRLREALRETRARIGHKAFCKCWVCLPIDAALAKEGTP